MAVYVHINYRYEINVSSIDQDIHTPAISLDILKKIVSNSSKMVLQNYVFERKQQKIR